MRPSKESRLPRTARRQGALGIALVVLLAAGGSAIAAPPSGVLKTAGLSLDAAERARLDAGEVLVRLERNPAGGPRPGLGIAALDEPPARAFAAVSDLPHWSEFMPYMRRSEARRQRDGSWLASQSLALPTGERHYQTRAVGGFEGSAERAVWRLSWSYVPGSGNIAAQSGSWTLLPYGNGRTLAILRLASDPGGLSAWLADRATQKSLPWILAGLRQQAHRDRYAAAGDPGLRRGGRR